MKSTERHCPKSEAIPFNLDTHTNKVTESLLIHLSVYNANSRGTLVLIELDDEEQVWIESTHGTHPSPYQHVADLVNEQFQVNVVGYVEGLEKQYSGPAAKLEVVQRVTPVDGKLVVTSHPMFQILTPFNYYPRMIDGQFTETGYIVPLDYPL